MPKHLVPHDLSIDMAKKVTEKAFETYAAQFAEFNPKMHWATPTRAELSFNARIGIRVTGSMDILPKHVDIDLEVPFILLPFKKRTIEIVEREILAWIAKAKAGEI